MRVWAVIGTTFTLIGLIVLILGIVQIGLIYNTYNQLGSVGQYLGTVMGTTLWVVFAPYLAVSLVFFVIGGVGFIAGRGSKADVTVSVMNEPSIPNKMPELQHGTKPPNVQRKSTITCGNCGTINDIDALYCKKCALKFR